jgi:hypothetical protein
MRRRRLITPLAVTATAVAMTLATALAGAGSASAHNGSGPGAVKVLNSTVLAPFNVSVDKGRVLVADGGTSLVSKIKRDGSLQTVATGHQPGDVAGVATGGGAIAYTGSDFAAGGQSLTIHRPGHADVVADISGFEAKHNPDKHVWYGVKNASSCVSDALTAADVPVYYQGVVDSHAYSVAYAGHGWWYVADAAGNDIVRVSPKGHVSLVSLLPKQPTKITAEMAGALGLPDCVAGITYAFEPVPTDVEVWHGKLFVSTLPGGPEDPSLGARGSVYTLRPWGHPQRLATGFLGATNLAVGRHGSIYVTELFAGQISKVWHGHGKPVVALPGAVSVEYSCGYLYAGTLGPSDDEGNPTGPGSVVRVRL